VTDTGQRIGTSSSISRSDLDGPTGWTAWVVFAGVIMAMVGTFHAVSGLVALLRDEYYVVRPSGLIVTVDYTAWGWVHLLLGALVAVAGVAVMTGQVWARVVGVVLAMLSATANLLFIAAYPLWSMIIIALDVVVIYALIVHGREVKDV
jgi:hypothetical protein